jgi:transposase
MNPFPAARSVLVLDNCRIHHNEALTELVRAAGCLILYLPAYSPDMNPIEESFSTCMRTLRLSKQLLVLTRILLLVKAFLRCHGYTIRRELDPVAALIEACSCITAEKAYSWFKRAGYIRVG